MCARFNQHRAAVHNGVAIVPHAIFRWHLVIGHAGFRQHGADPDFLAIGVGRPSLLDDIAANPRALIDAQPPGDAAAHTADGAADHGTDWPSGALTLAGA